MGSIGSVIDPVYWWHIWSYVKLWRIAAQEPRISYVYMTSSILIRTGSSNGLSPIPRLQNISWTNVDLLLMGPIQTTLEI